MARGVNKVILIGNLGADPEVRYTPNGNAVANISLATSMTWRDKQTGETQDRTEWHRVVFFNRLAEIVGEYLRKGSKVFIEGSLRTRKWQDNTGADRYTTEIIANEMQMLDSRNTGNNNNYQQQGAPAGNQNQKQFYNNDYSNNPGNQNPAAANTATNNPTADDVADFDDDIPF